MALHPGSSVRRLWDTLSHPYTCGCVLFLMAVLHQTQVVAQTTADVSPQDSKASQQEERDMMKGLAAGFGFFFGILLLVCVVWCLCCGNVCNKDKGRDGRAKGKVAPSPPVSGNVRTRANIATSSS